MNVVNFAYCIEQIFYYKSIILLFMSEDQYPVIWLEA